MNDLVRQKLIAAVFVTMSFFATVYTCKAKDFYIMHYCGVYSLLLHTVISVITPGL